jgi:hypothetical protein
LKTQYERIARYGMVFNRQSRKMEAIQRVWASSPMVEMMAKVASADGEMSSEQKSYIDSARSQFVREEKSRGTWS